ncbi:GNAT family N-acetyltransferase [Streptomyces sp. TR06-5]|uniref:GNAT family N-acetyltransferase n=1 Tax=unclassified Streptomyces TaxID=2593676 RepID=UPI0039A163A0
MSVPALRTVGAADRDAVAELLHAVFRDDPVSRWVFPDAERREVWHPRLFGAFLDHGLQHGTVHATRDGAGAAVWFAVEGGELRGGDDLGARLEKVDPGNDRLPTLGELTEAVHPTDRDHAYLQAIAVSQDRQGRGVGSSLLAPVLERCDREGLPAYLEASSDRSRGLYARHGFVTLERIVHLPDGPPMYPMWREPATA